MVGRSSALTGESSDMSVVQRAVLDTQSNRTLAERLIDHCTSESTRELSHRTREKLRSLAIMLERESLADEAERRAAAHEKKASAARSAWEAKQEEGQNLCRQAETLDAEISVARQLSEQLPQLASALEDSSNRVAAAGQLTEA